MQPTDSNKFTEQAWDAIVKSQEVAKFYKNQYLEVEHIILAIIEQKEGLANTILTQAKVEIPRFKQEIERFINRQPRAMVTQLYLGRGLDLLLDRAEASKESWQDKFISIEHLLMGFAEDDRLGRKALRVFNLDPQDLEKTIKAIRGTQKVTQQNQEEKYQALEKYGRDLSEQAKLGKLDPVIGRDEEIRRVIQVLSRRSK
jgi:ATP-dependent Clp protease ATP-binding subunit ClpB